MHKTLRIQNAGKRRKSPSVRAVSDDLNPQCRLFVNDKNNGTSFLVDTGAEISVLPKRFAIHRQLTTDNLRLYAANGTTINTFGDRLICVNLGLRRQFKWRFIVADVTKPILGADFLQHYGLLVDIRNRRLVDSITNISTPARVVNASSSESVHIISRDKSVFHDILLNFPMFADVRPFRKK